MISFKQAILRFASPQLKKWGYEHTEDLRDRNLVYAFHKHLGNNIQAFVVFQRHQHRERAVGHSFTVELLRYKTANIMQWHKGLYEGALAARIGHVLWINYGLRVYAQPDHWWEASDARALEEAFADAVDKLNRYGLPWLEDPHSRQAMPLPLSAWNEFQEALIQSISPELGPIGYEVREHEKLEWPPSRGKPFYYFAKSVSAELNSFVILHPMCFSKVAPDMDDSATSISPSFYFDVLLFRKRSADPYDQEFVAGKKCFEIWLSRYLPTLAGPANERPQPALWKYTTEGDLITQLKDAVNKVKQHGIPLLETVDK